MTNKKTREKLREYNAIYKATDAIYSELAKKSGLSPCAFWLMYFIREADGVCTQKEICGQWTMSKKTVHSALKGLEADGYLTLSASKTDKRSKDILLTDRGIEFTRKNIDVVFKLEQKAFQKMGDEGFHALIERNREFQELLRAEADQFLK